MLGRASPNWNFLPVALSTRDQGTIRDRARGHGLLNEALEEPSATLTLTRIKSKGELIEVVRHVRVFALSPPTVAGGVWQEAVLDAFSGAEQQNGYDPSAALVLSREQILYGTTASGGTSNFGTVFAVTPMN